VSILISGDFHADVAGELYCVNKKTLKRKYGHEKYGGINYHIILGDGGFMWPDNEVNELKYYQVLAKRSFPILCVMGNHDPVLGCSDLPEIDIGIREKIIVVNKENPLVAYLKRGRVYTIENNTFLVLGGALSIDKEIRKLKKAWWKEEYWSEKDKNDLFDMLKTNTHFDYVLSHTGPSRINQTINPLRPIGRMPLFHDEVAALNERIDGIITCKQWFCGHMHRDSYFYDTNMQRSYQYLYRTTVLLSGDEIIKPLSGGKLKEKGTWR